MKTVVMFGTVLLYSSLMGMQASRRSAFVKDINNTGWQCLEADVVFEETAMSALSCSRLCVKDDNCTIIVHTASDRRCKGCRSLSAFGSQDHKNGVSVYSKVQKECDDGWFQFEDMCYWTGTELMPFVLAAFTCAGKGSRVVHIETAEENQFLLDKHLDRFDSNGDLSKCVFIGVTDEVEEGTWRYYDTNETASFLDFVYPEPSNSNGQEHCAVFIRRIMTWTDYPCFVPCLPQCEKRAMN